MTNVTDINKNDIISTPALRNERYTVCSTELEGPWLRVVLSGQYGCRTVMFATNEQVTVHGTNEPMGVSLGTSTDVPEFN